MNMQKKSDSPTSSSSDVPNVQRSPCSAASLAPRPIQQLPTDVVNRIAAGEVIQRPANAIKELLENCLDADSTQIQITVRAGGLKLLQVQDNGCGIRTADLPILCERFTTSKLHEFSDLNKLNTFGFRGEALASLSHVCLLSVTTRTSDQVCAYRCAYRNGKLTEQPVPCAGNPGSTITAEDLFYNAPLRKAALCNPREEFARVVDVVSQYAIHYAPKCGFHLRNLNTGPNAIGGDLRTQAGWSRMDAIRSVVSSVVSQHLVSFDSCQSGASEVTRLAIERLGLRYEGLLTTPSQVTSGASPSLKLMLFINNRMVECSAIKRSLESSYSTVLSRTLSDTSKPSPSGRRLSGSKPTGYRSSLFVYLNLQLPPESLDVNVHPTKSEVHFLHEDQIVSGLQDAVEHCLLSSAQLRSFLVRPLVLPELDRNHTAYNNPADKGEQSVSRLPRPQDKVRVDIKEQRLERFMIDRYQHYQTVNSTEDCSSVQHSGFPSCGNMNESLSTTFSSGSPKFDGDDLQNPLKSTHESDTVGSVSETNPTSKSEPTTSTKFTPHLTAQPMIRQPTSVGHFLKTSSTVAKSSPEVKRRTVRLDSVLKMRGQIVANADDRARQLLRSCKFVGLIDHTRCLVQHCTDLLLVRLRPLSEAFFYQLLVLNFANHGEIILSEPAPIVDLLKLNNLSTNSSKLNSDEAVEDAATTLLSHATMLWDYFSLKIEPLKSNEQPALLALPLLLKGYIPDFDRLPVYITRLATEVDWTDEMACFEAICCITSEFYAPNSPLCTKPTDDDEDSSDDGKLPPPSTKTNQVSVKPSSVRWRWLTEHVLWPALSSSLIPRRGLLYSDPPLSQLSRPDGLSSPSVSSCALFRLTSLSDLYKVFERC
ncbi:hypothetical protein P879_03307 [Paragonimus westermani]|uniref:DNA mismatch repair protein S5 domain-containing protein n=1 Tax=Paragonimus westermani TaxID=34504 RepID=A0A8T0DUB2_9TREM|nr:hypothetical protein P879_03307 [Paragonimus westermani]